MSPEIVRKNILGFLVIAAFGLPADGFAQWVHYPMQQRNWGIAAGTQLWRRYAERSALSAVSRRIVETAHCG
jgi:hypothetical protein